MSSVIFTPEIDKLIEPYKSKYPCGKKRLSIKPFFNEDPYFADVEILSYTPTVSLPKDVEAFWLGKNTRKWMTTEDFRYKVTFLTNLENTPWVYKFKGKNHTLTEAEKELLNTESLVEAGFVFDGSSIPRPLHCFVNPSNYNSWWASIGHDYDYYLDHKDLSPNFNMKICKLINDLKFAFLMKYSGASDLEVTTFFKAVHFFGGRDIYKDSY